MSYFIVTRNHLDSKGTQHIDRLSYSTDLNKAYRELSRLQHIDPYQTKYGYTVMIKTTATGVNLDD